MAAVSSQACVRPAALAGVETLDGALSRAHLLCLRALATASGLARNRGMQRLSWPLARRVFGLGHSAILHMSAGGQIKIRLEDGYWTRLLIRGFLFEPDTWTPLARALNLPNAFLIDCGANIGYWSVVSSQFLPPGRILAIEASPPNFAQLQENARLNGGKFTPIWNALWSADGEDAEIVSHAVRHAGSSIVNRREKIGQSGYTKYLVKTITLDTLCDQYAVPHDARLVVKLDVEGAEIETLRGAHRVFSERDTLLLYEDHGQDRECRTSDFMMNEMKYAVFHCGTDGSVQPIHSLDAIRALKTNVHDGYNFAACAHGSAFLSQLDRP